MRDLKRYKRHASYQTGGSDFTVQEPERDNKEAVLVRVHPHLKQQRRDYCIKCKLLFKWTFQLFC